MALIQDGYRITLLADWGKVPRKIEQKIDPAIDVKTEPLKLVNEMPASAFFKYGAELLKVNSPHITDWSINSRMKRIGLEPGKSFDDSRVSDDVLARGVATGRSIFIFNIAVRGRARNPTGCRRRRVVN